MIDAKAAVQSARSYAAEVLGDFKPTVGEIEREEYKARDVWKITLGLPSDVYLAGRASLGLPSKEYKSFPIDAETVQALAMKIRELTS